MVEATKVKLRPLYQWLDDRMGISALMNSALHEAVPEQGGWAYTLGSATLILIALQIVTGIFLTMMYVPSFHESYQSLHYLQTNDLFGAWVRGMHLWGSYTLMLVIGLHMIRTFMTASYKRPRELNWVSGALLFFVVLGLAITGAMLPGDQAAYWTMTVVTNIPHYIPFIGDYIRWLWRGGKFIGPITFTRTYGIHIWLLPPMLLGLIGLHLYLLRRHGEFGAWVNYDTEGPDPDREIAARIAKVEPPYPSRDVDPKFAAPNRTVDFFPNQVFKDTLVSLLLVAVVFVMALLMGAPLDGPANPATLTYVPTPEWFYLPLDQLLVLGPQTWLIAFVVFVIPGITATLFILLPFIDRSPERNPLRRAHIIVPGLFVIFMMVTLSVLGINRLYNL